MEHWFEPIDDVLAAESLGEVAPSREGEWVNSKTMIFEDMATVEVPSVDCEEMYEMDGENTQTLS